MLALLLLLFLSKPLPLTFDPTTIATYTCSTKDIEHEGSYIFCKQARMTFRKMRIADRPPKDYSLRLNYSNGTMLMYNPGKCKITDYKRGIYKCPDVLTGPR